MELTTDTLEVKPLNHNQKRFVKNLLKTKGNQKAAYTMTYGVGGATAAVNSTKLMKRPEVQNALTHELERHGLSKDYFIKKFKDLTNATDKDGHPDNRIQFDTTKIGMEMHGMLKKEDNVQAGININYNIDSDKLSGVLEKLAQVTRKLELSGLPNGQVEDAQIIESPTIDEEDNGGEVAS
jgi:phage terminase small subunit